VLHDPREPQQAHYVCEGVKADDGQAFMTAAALVVPTMPPTVRHFGYQLYEHLIAKRWGALDESSKAQLKAVSLQVCPARLTPRLPRGRARRSAAAAHASGRRAQLIADGTTDMLREPRFLKEKAVQVREPLQPPARPEGTRWTGCG
jgi:hypothetical protein